MFYEGATVTNLDVIYCYLFLDNNEILLASCSQDCYIRLWRITRRQEQNDGVVAMTDDDESQLRLKRITFSATVDGEISVFLWFLMGTIE